MDKGLFFYVYRSRPVSETTGESYDATQYERPSVTVDVIIFSLVDDDLKVLLIRRKRWPYEGAWAIPGGFVEMDESLEAAAARELAEETGVRDVTMEQLQAFGDPDRDPRTRVITVAYFTLLPAGAVPHLEAGSDAAAAGWFSVGDLPALAFDHDDIMEYALARLRNKLKFAMEGIELLPGTFTLSELQQAYEVIRHPRS